MSARPVSPHSAATLPWRMMIPFDFARGAVGPMSALYGASLRKPLGIGTARSCVSLFWFATANAIASASFALSSPTAEGSALGHSPRAGKAARGLAAWRAATKVVAARHAVAATIAHLLDRMRLNSTPSTGKADPVVSHRRILTAGLEVS